MSKTCLFILGMHRSGTSALAGSLFLLDMRFDANLVEAVSNDNPKGYWEPVEVVKINEDIFSAFNMHHMDFSSFPNGWMDYKVMNPIKHRIRDWFKKSFSDESFIVVKDPRLCRTLPLWVSILEQEQGEAKYIHIFRHPMEVVGSLRARDNTFSVIEGLLVWLAHVLDSFAPSSPGYSTIVGYGTFMNDPVQALNLVAGNLSVEWPTAPEQVAGSLKNFLEPALIHQHFKGDIPSPLLNKLTQSVFDCLESYDLKSPEEGFYACIKTYEVQLQEFRVLFEGVYKSYSCRLEAEKINAKKQIVYRDALLIDLKGQLESEKANAKEQIEYRDALVAEVREQLKAEKANAKEQIEYRDALVAELKDKLEANTLFYMLKKSSE